MTDGAGYRETGVPARKREICVHSIRADITDDFAMALAMGNGVGISLRMSEVLGL